MGAAKQPAHDAKTTEGVSKIQKLLEYPGVTREMMIQAIVDDMESPQQSDEAYRLHGLVLGPKLVLPDLDDLDPDSVGAVVRSIRAMPDNGGTIQMKDLRKLISACRNDRFWCDVEINGERKRILTEEAWCFEGKIIPITRSATRIGLGFQLKQSDYVQQPVTKVEAAEFPSLVDDTFLKLVARAEAQGMSLAQRSGNEQTPKLAVTTMATEKVQKSSTAVAFPPANHNLDLGSLSFESDTKAASTPAIACTCPRETIAPVLGLGSSIYARSEFERSYQNPFTVNPRYLQHADGCPYIKTIPKFPEWDTAVVGDEFKSSPGEAAVGSRQRNVGLPAWPVLGLDFQHQDDGRRDCQADP